jgi:hypothetical protein
LAIHEASSGFDVARWDAIEDVADGIEPAMGAAAGKPRGVVRPGGVEEPVDFGVYEFFHQVVYVHAILRGTGLGAT